MSTSRRSTLRDAHPVRRIHHGQRAHGRCGARGQVLPLGLVLLLACLGATFFMFNSGQAVDEKLNVINAADAAAYSAGVMQARTLNYEAYLNRAIIANELAIAQAISMVSWTRYFQTAVTDVWGIDAFITGSGLLLGPDGARAALLGAALAGTAYANAEFGGAVLAQSVNYVRQANELIVPAHAAAIIALRASQRAIDVAMSTGTLQRNLAQEIARGTDRTLSVELVPDTIPGLASFTRSYGRDSGPPGGVGDERGRLAGAVMRSRDAFTADRSFTLHGANIFPWLRDVTLKKRGGTDLVSFDEWQAMDTLSGHARYRRCGFFGSALCPDIELPFAGGGADLRAAQAGTSARGYHGGAWAENPKAAEMTEDYWTTRVTARGWRGISDSQDLADLDSRDDPRVALSFFVYKPDATSRVAGRNPNLRPSGALDLFDAGAPAGRIGALARAEVFFSRPQRRSDGARELPSLYSPYWKVRLVAPNAADRAYAALRQNNLTLGP